MKWGQGHRPKKVDFWQLIVSTSQIGERRSVCKWELLGEITPTNLHLLDVTEDQANVEIWRRQELCWDLRRMGRVWNRKGREWGALPEGIKCPAESAQYCCHCLWQLCHWDHKCAVASGGMISSSPSATGCLSFIYSAYIYWTFT